MNQLWLIALLIVSGVTPSNIPPTENSNSSLNSSVHSNSTKIHHETFKVADWKFNELKLYILYAMFIVVVVIMKIIYFHLPKIPSIVPESCVLIITGVVFGLAIRFLMDAENVVYFKLTPHLFFYVLLPPIILESAYSLYHRNFLNNLLSIMVFAVFGTLLNFLLIGLSLWGFSQFGQMADLNLSIKHCLLFSSLIVAVDPVAVLAIFKEVKVNQDLYYLVFGESLLNDAVTVVLYEMMQEYSIMPEVGARNIVLGIISFFTVSIGAMLIGVIIGALGCVMIRWMHSKEAEMLEPILLMSMGYLSYLCADMCGWSGIISTILCGIIQAAYAMYGISDKSRIALKRFVKILAAICEALIFLFLGVELAIGKLQWHTGFVLCSLFLCLVVRFMVTFTLSGFINKIHMSLRNIPLREKVIISYGGLRGAVAFSLAVVLHEKAIADSKITKEIITTATLFIILFSVMIQGVTVKPLVKLLQISLDSDSKTKTTRLSLFDELNDSVIEYVDTGVEALLGQAGRSYTMMLLEQFNRRYITPWLQRSEKGYAKMTIVNEKINMQMLDHLQATHGTAAESGGGGICGLPHSYQNLLHLMLKPAVAVAKRNLPQSHREARYLHTMSDTTGRQISRDISPPPLKHLRPFLLRASAISDSGLNPYETPHAVTVRLFSDSVSVVKAKNKFLNLRRRNNPDTEGDADELELVPIAAVIPEDQEEHLPNTEFF